MVDDATPRPAVLVTGANGFVGTHLCAYLEEKGYTVRGAVRRHACSDQMDVGALENFSHWPALLGGMDTVIHLAGLAHQGGADAAAYEQANVNATRALLQACERDGGIKRFIFLSTIAVLGQRSGEQPLAASAVNPAGNYASSKARCETIVQESSLPWTIMRIPLLYGRGVKANMLQLLKLVEKEWPLPLAGVQNRRNIADVRNVCDALEHCLQFPELSNERMLHIADARPVSTPAMIRMIAEGMEKRTRLFPVPQALLKYALMATGRGAIYTKLCDNLEMELATTRARLGWNPPIATSDGLRTMAQWYTSKS